MKGLNYKILIVSGLFCVISFYSCKSSSTEPGPPADTRNFYPVTNGSWYKYSMTQTDSTGSINIATRTAHINDSIVIDNKDYQVQVDSIFFTGSTQVSYSYFRKTSAGVYFYLDTTGLSNTLADSLLPYLTFTQEIIAFSFPLQTGRDWLAFNMNLNYMGLTPTFNPISMRTTIVGTEDISLQLPNGNETKSAVKLRMNLNTYTSPFQTVPQVLTSEVWLVENIGIVKWSGNATIINALTGGGINFDDSTSVITQSLIDFQIQQ